MLGPCPNPAIAARFFPRNTVPADGACRQASPAASPGTDRILLADGLACASRGAVMLLFGGMGRCSCPV